MSLEVGVENYDISTRHTF